MKNLEIYKNLGCKFILCKADKTPDTPGSDYWDDDFNHISIDQAQTMQNTGRLIGAILPPDIIVLNLNKHTGQTPGTSTLKEIEEKYNLNLSYKETLLVTTGRKGHHYYYKIPEGKIFLPGDKAPGIELKTHAINNGYVICAGSGGYSFLDDDAQIASLPAGLSQWLCDCENNTLPATLPDALDSTDEKKRLPVKTLRQILNKINPANYEDEKKFDIFIKSCVAASGATGEVKEAIIEWLQTHELFKNDKSLPTIINELKETGSVNVGSLIYYMREEGLSQYFIGQVVKFDSISNMLVDAEFSEIELPFAEPDYLEVARSSAAQEFFHFQGNTAAAAILEMALDNRVIYSDAEKLAYYFDGNRWIELNNYFGIIYTIIFRIVKIVYFSSETDDSKESNDRLYKCFTVINATHWKQMTWKETCYKESIYMKSIEWDSPKIVESITTRDGVVDFRNSKMEPRKGNYSEFRRSFFDYTTDEIMQAEVPETFINFFDSLFPDPDTRDTAKYCVSMSISGNSGKRLFQLWQGIGSNGKSTLLETIKNVLGREKSYKFPSDILLTGMKRENYKAEIAKFQGKYFCYSSEAEKGARLSQNTIKDMTGDEAISARELYKSPIEFEATWQIIYAVNELPAIHGDDHAFNDRLIVIPFNMFFYKDEEKKNSALGRGISEKYIMKADSSKNFKQGLFREKAGIIKWMIENYNDMNINQGGQIPESEECRAKKTAYITDNDDIGVFIAEYCEIDRSGEFNWFTPVSTFTEEFREFSGAHKRGEKSIVYDVREYNAILKTDIEIESILGQDKKTRVIRNIRLRGTKEIKEINELKRAEKDKDTFVGEDGEPDFSKIPF